MDVLDRMPVILPQAAWPIWLGEVAGAPDSVLDVLPAEHMDRWPVSDRIGSLADNDAGLLNSITLE